MALGTGGTVAGTSLAAGALAGKPPKLGDVQRMPDPLDTDARMVERKKAEKRKGRGSTLLDDEDSSSATYVNQLLGE